MAIIKRYSLNHFNRCGNLLDWSPLVWFCISVVICFGLFVGALSIQSNAKDKRKSVIRVYCASAATVPMNDIVEQFNLSKLAISENIVVEITRSGGSGALSGQINAEALTGAQYIADIFVCADSNRMSILDTKKVINDSFPVASQFPVIAIRENSGLNLNSVNNFRSLLNLKIKLGVGSASSAIGFKTDYFAKLENCSDLLQARKTAEFENVISLAQALSIGSVDAAIVWDSTVHQFNQSNNRRIKILSYLRSKFPESGSTTENPLETVALTNNNYSRLQRSDKFLLGQPVLDPRSGCFIEVGRSNSVNRHADLFYNYLKSNRGLVLADFIDAGFSNSPMEFLLLNNGR